MSQNEPGRRLRSSDRNSKDKPQQQPPMPMVAAPASLPVKSEVKPIELDDLLIVSQAELERD